jgi:hypothetical protein
MSSREKDQSDFDLELFVDLFDTAMSSDNPTVKKALRNLILISSMVNAQDQGRDMSRGPLRRILDDVSNINRRLHRMEAQAKEGEQTAPLNDLGISYHYANAFPNVKDPTTAAPTILSTNATLPKQTTHSQVQHVTTAMNDLLIKLETK